MKKVKLFVCTHKNYFMPKDKLYVPLLVGADLNKCDGEYLKDNTGDNISNKNPYFCELTGIYWIWKNITDLDYVGIVHYRRYFSLYKGKMKTEEEKFKHILNSKEAQDLLKDTDIILPKKRRYYIENLYNHYAHTMYIEPLDEVGKIIKENHKEYYQEFEKLHKRRSAHMFNMFIMDKKDFDNYCEFLFSTLFELEKKIDVTKYDKFHARFFGRVSELLLDVYINTNQIKYKEVNVIDMQKINWWKKGTSFLNAKFFGKKYDSSF